MGGAGHFGAGGRDLIVAAWRAMSNLVMSAPRPTRFDLVREAPKALTIAQERDLARRAHDRAPTPSNRTRRARLAFRDDDFAAVIALLAGHDALTFEDFALLAEAHLAHATPADDAAARDAAARALALADSPARRGAALAKRAKAERRLGRLDAARASLAAALRENPHDQDACNRLTALDLAAGRPADVVAWCDALAARGVGHARLHGARVLAEAARGDIAAARRAAGFELLGARARLDPPPGWADLDGFNAALAAQLLAHPARRHQRHGSAAVDTWRIEALRHARAPLVDVLLDTIIRHVIARVAELATADHPWVADRPPRALLRAHCLITEASGHEIWHLHPAGWLSGVYYVQAPAAIVAGSDVAGRLAIGLPPELVGHAAAAAFGETLILPEPGTIVTFPSHIFHRTFPHRARGTRICVAFDVEPR